MVSTASRSQKQKQKQSCFRKMITEENDSFLLHVSTVIRSQKQRDMSLIFMVLKNLYAKYELDRSYKNKVVHTFLFLPFNQIIVITR